MRTAVGKLANEHSIFSAMTECALRGIYASR